MVYISNGQVLDGQSRSPWRLSFITDLFWGITDFFILFFQSIISPDLSRRGGRTIHSSSSSSGKNDGPPGFPRRRMGRINGGGGPSPPPMAGGG
ncbi:selenoprotein K [Rhinophrynus dorsalis]